MAAATLGMGLGLGLEVELELTKMRGRSWASSLSLSSRSVVLRFMQEQRSREAKKAEATLEPTQLAALSSFSHVIKLQLLFAILCFYFVFFFFFFMNLTEGIESCFEMVTDQCFYVL